MEKKKNLQQYIDKLAPLFSAVRRLGRGDAPRRDWNIIMVLFGLILIFLGVMATVSYLSVGSTTDLISGNGSYEVKTIDRTALTDIVEEFKEKEALFEQRKASPPSIVDPAL